jgi:hypothetical protein
MKEYWYNQYTKHLYTDEDMKRPFLCGSEAVPLKFNSSSECLEFLKENNFEGSVMYKLQFH